MAPARFEYATISWSSVDALTSPDLWTQWALNAEFRALPPTQEMRHRYLNYSRNHAVLVRPTSPQDGQLLFKFEWDKVKLSLRVTSAMSGEFVCTALDAFVGLCDRMQEEADRMRLGCCQVLCIVNKKHLDPELRKQTLEHIFGHATLELEQIAEGAIGTTYITDEDITDEAEEPSSEEACQRTEAERQRSLAWRKETAKASKSIANLNSCYVSLKGVMDKSAKNANVLSVEMKKDLQEAEGKIRTLKLSATAIIGTDEAARAQSDPPALGEASAIQDTVKAAQMLLKDARKVFAEKAAEAKALKEPKPKKASKPKGFMTNDSSMDSTAKLLELYGPEEQQMTRGPGRNKRRLPLLDERKFRRAVSVRGASERAAAEIWNIIQSDEKQISRGRAERLVAAELKPWIDAMQDEPFLRHDGSTVALPVVDLKPCLQHLCQKSVDFRHAIEKALEKGPLTPIIFCDEAQAGNVLGVNKSRKANLYYISWLELGHLIKNANCWIPLATVQSYCLAQLQGGHSSIMIKILDKVLTEENETGFALSGGAVFKRRAQAFFIGDLEAVRSIYSFKGIIGDAMHLYFVNGICSWEIALFLQIVFDHTPLKLSALQDVVLAGNWVSAKSTGRTRTYLKNLFHERLYGDGLFKGQRHQTTALLPLLFYFTLTAIEPSGLVPARYVAFFRTLCGIASFLRQLKFGGVLINEKSMARLDELQRRHHDMFAVYDVDHKPKHHMRLHLPAQLLRTGCFVDCEPVEDKHRLYKSGVADRQDSLAQNHSAFSRSVLPRLLQDTLLQLNKHGVPHWQLVGHIEEASLEDKLYFVTTELQTSK
ncbi:Uncharacterized protein SCF082_LOCUS8040, partial [Durusdinium trenchii]